MMFFLNNKWLLRFFKQKTLSKIIIDYLHVREELERFSELNLKYSINNAKIQPFVMVMLPGKQQKFTKFIISRLLDKKY